MSKIISPESEVGISKKLTYLMKSNISKIYHSIINTGTQHCNSEFNKKRIRIVNLFMLVTSVVIFSFGILNAILGFPILVFIDYLIVILIASSFIFNYYKKWNFSKFIITYLLATYLMVFPLFFGDIGTEYYNFIILIIGFYIIDKKINLILLSIYILFMFFLSKYLIHTVSYPDKYQILETVHYYPCVVVSIISTAVAISMFKFDTENFQKELDQKIIELENKNKFNKSLLRELNHRVKNNLQLISGLFTLQSYQSQDSKISEALNHARKRIDAITILYQHLYKNNKTLEPDIRSYLNDLINYIGQSFEIEDELNLIVEVNQFNLTIECIVHIGLIINELLTNAIKYGTIENNKLNRIDIEVKNNSEKLLIRVKDNGVGFPDNFNQSLSASFGMELVTSISKKYNGTVEITNIEGAEVQVTLCDI